MGAIEKDKPPRLLQYLDYRAFLADYCEWRRLADPGFSQRVFAKEADLPASSSSLLPAVLKGRRNLSQNLRVKFSKALKLAERDANYFDVLVQFNQAKGMSEKNFFFTQLSKFRTSRAHVLNETQFEFFSKWYYSAIRSFFSMETGERNPVAIAARLFPEVTPAQVEDAIRLLLSLELIKKTANGYAVTEKHISTPKDVQARTAREHMLELTRMSMEILDKTPAALRQYNALMFTVSPQGFETVKERIRSFLEELREILDRDQDEDRIYSLTLQLFPNSRLPDPAADAAKKPAPGTKGRGKA
ncbi:MAG: hypothetical protein K0Q91_2064 [Fibrobacteria bacterium]|jgi:uncharacterized protein (TIGR02147 family)|nr:hypothetical protein [Fibrobacteria bacterium]